MNGILLVDKPQDWTSHDVVAKLRGVFGERRIGHSGTLDPLATGLLVVFLGRATKAVEFSEAAEKEYVAHLRLGVETDTQDITGTVLRTSPENPDRSALEAVLPQFCGDIQQLPPMYSAIKVNGKKLYEIARKGGEVERQPRQITIHELTLLGEENGDYLLRVRCSKGTYIRTLCHDIGQALGCGGVMTALRRTRIGGYDVRDAYTVTAPLEMDRASAESLLLPLDSLFSDLPAVTLSGVNEAHCRNGRPFSLPLPDGRYRLYGKDGQFLMIAAAASENVIAVKRFY
jgi:tRNA pseudouridine55 synthase